MKKLIILSFLLLFSLTGCVSYTELNELGIVSSLGISYQDDAYQINTNLVIPEKEDGTSSYYNEYYNSTGETLDESLNNLYLQINKKIDLAHLELVIIDEEVATNHLLETVSFFLKEPTSRNSFPIVLAYETTPENLIQEEKEIDDITSLLMNNQITKGTTLALSIEDFAKLLLEQQSAVLPCIGLEDVPTTKGLALISNNHLLTYLTEEESNSYLYLTNQIKTLSLTITCPNDTKAAIKVKENNTLKNSHDNKITYEIQSSIEEKENTCNKNITTLYEEEIQKRIITLLNKTKETNTDLLHLTTYIYRKNYSYYKNHQDDLFNSLTYDLTFKTQIQEPSTKVERSLSYE